MHLYLSPRGWVASERKKRERSSAFFGDGSPWEWGAEKAMRDCYKKFDFWYVKKHTEIVSHTYRRSFATNLYRMGYSLAQIMAVTGHSTESQLREYIGIDAEENAEKMALGIMQRLQNQGNTMNGGAKVVNF